MRKISMAMSLMMISVSAFAADFSTIMIVSGASGVISASDNVNGLSIECVNRTGALCRQFDLKINGQSEPFVSVVQEVTGNGRSFSLQGSGMNITMKEENSVYFLKGNAFAERFSATFKAADAQMPLKYSGELELNRDTYVLTFYGDKAADKLVEIAALPDNQDTKLAVAGIAAILMCARK